MPDLYLNHAGTSWPKPDVVREAFASALDTSPDRWPDEFAEAHAAVASAFGVSPDTLLVTPGATSALAVAVADVPWSPGDRVLTSGLEHEALARPLAKLARRGVEVIAVPPGDGPVDLSVLRAHLQRGRVRLVAMSVASNVTGELFPYAAITDTAHAHGAWCLLDGAQAAGWLDLPLAELGVDLFAFAGHKGPQAPYGVGGLYVRPGLALDTPRRSRPGYCDTGSVDRPALVALAAGLAHMTALAPLARARTVESRFRATVAEFDGVTPLGGGPRLPTCSLVLTDRTPADIAAALAARGVVTGRGSHCAPLAHATLGTGPAGTLRFSFGPTHTEADADHAAEALREALFASH